VTNLGYGSVRVVGGGFDEDGRTARTISFVGQLLVHAPFELAGALLDAAIDVFTRHVHRLCRVDRGAQPRVARRIAAAGPGGYGDLSNHLCPG
jgi:hypothetical protein